MIGADRRHADGGVVDQDMHSSQHGNRLAHGALAGGVIRDVGRLRQ
jgi:hypothetical protein